MKAQRKKKAPKLASQKAAKLFMLARSPSHIGRKRAGHHYAPRAGTTVPTTGMWSEQCSPVSASHEPSMLKPRSIALCARTQLSPSCFLHAAQESPQPRQKKAGQWAHHDHADAGVRRCEEAIQPVRRRNRRKGGGVIGAAMLGQASLRRGVDEPTAQHVRV